MSFRNQANLSDDYHLHRRITACAAKEGIPNPEAWVRERVWMLSAQPGWSAAYASAAVGGNTTPGNSEDVITDGMILAAVQAIKNLNASDANPSGGTAN